ncbi:nucleotidyltransferase substrate binding protein [Halobacillus sp. B23F22_1]|uniref:nucleotidyltransferase substrate binding protein n=1 Tax=Halobacillus sp. B23F22_1 TaxID=3459514 RepID=UPI00373E0797
MYDVEGVDAGSPKGVIRSCREIHLLKDEDAVLALEMVNDRNLTVHTYNEEVAIKIYKNLPLYNNLLDNKQIMERLGIKKCVSNQNLDEVV